MTNTEAIETLRANYPDACYEQLREAVDVAIRALKEQEATGNTIYRRAALDALNKLDVSDGVGISSIACDVQKSAITAIQRLPSAQPAKPPKWVAKDKYIKNKFAAFLPHCPQCNAEITTGQCYCMICGQHIDWSEDDE